MDGHLFVIQSAKCTPKNEVHGAKATDAAIAEQDEVTGHHIKAHGVYTETFDTGDKLFYAYSINGLTDKDGNFTTGSATYKISGGTGKMKGMGGSGTCKTKASTDGGLEYHCSGEYAAAAAKMAAKSAAAETK